MTSTVPVAIAYTDLDSNVPYPIPIPLKDLDPVVLFTLGGHLYWGQ